jgi:hypothetical protein
MIQDHFKAETEPKGWGGMSMVHEKRRGWGNKPGSTFFVGLLEDNFFQPKKEKTEAALQLTERYVRPIRS